MRTARLGWLAIAITMVASAALAETFIYPSKGQSNERQKKDKGECHVWAVDSSGWDPANLPPPPAQVNQPVTQGGVVKGGARGAALGAIGGAIGGNAGKGAAAGAAMGAAYGGMKRADGYRQQAAYNQSQQQAYQSEVAAGNASFQRAFAACMEGRGYTIK